MMNVPVIINLVCVFFAFVNMILSKDLHGAMGWFVGVIAHAQLAVIYYGFSLPGKQNND